LSFEYQLGGVYLYPYIGISFGADSTRHFFDLKDYTEVEIEVEARLSRRIPIVLYEDIPQYSHPEEGASYRPLYKEIVYEQGKKSYTLPLSEFITPSWWFSNRKLTENMLGKVNFSRIYTVQVHDCEQLPLNKLEKLTLRKIVFHKNLLFWWYSAAIAVLLYYLIWWGLRYFKHSTKYIVPGKELQVGNLADEESQKVLAYVSEHYANPELSLELAQKDLGLSEGKISQIIKSSSDLSFKRYLNALRLTEAKRLLLETDRPVMDIAFRVGYGNISHFNRVFKEAEGRSPNEYRKKPSGNP
jgi:AraC-like DNA-binding protein